MKAKVLFLTAIFIVGMNATRADILDDTYTVETTNPTRTVIVGVTMSSGWFGFPNTMMPDYYPVYPYEMLYLELPLYVEWIIDWDHTGDLPSAQRLDPPQPLSSFSWFTGNHSRFVAHVEQVGDHNGNPSLIQGHTVCPQGIGLEDPEEGSTPLTAEGKLAVWDFHGGIGAQTRIRLQDCRGGTGCPESYFIILEWDRPNTYYDEFTEVPGNYLPGMVHNAGFTVNHGSAFFCYMPTLSVEWVSADIGVPTGAGPSPRIVDAADLAYFFNFLGQPLRWGFATETPPNSPTFQCDFTPFEGSGSINAADLAAFASDLGESCQLTASKPGGRSEAAAILDWFGVAPTGGTVVVGPNGESVPGYEVVDWEKNRRAIADPYGYSRNVPSSAARDVPWSMVKRLFR